MQFSFFKASHFPEYMLFIFLKRHSKRRGFLNHKQKVQLPPPQKFGQTWDFHRDATEVALFWVMTPYSGPVQYITLPLYSLLVTPSIHASYWPA